MSKIARVVTTVVELDITIPALGLIFDSLELVGVKADPDKISVLNNNTFSYLNSYTSS